ncbi:MAG: FadR family transcriptional regulator [Oscillospiraceae bacterium]|nr:FadR family transcriptional regulator [Oscillospiraceae bacterium]
MEFSEIVAPTVKELFIRRIEDSILSGELAIGEQLPSERELAEQMHVSKTVVHAGITDMVRKGFLEVVPRKGVFVGDYANKGSLEALVSIMQHNGGQLDERNVRSLLEMRYAIESVCLLRILDRKDPQVTARLGEILRKAEQEAEAQSPNCVRLAEYYYTFHHTLCAASGNTIAPLIMNAFHVPAVRLWANSARALGPADSVGRLHRFYTLICQGEREKALKYLHWMSYESEEIVRENG